MIETVAKEIYETMRFGRLDETPQWVEDGNSLAQQAARKAARSAILSMRKPTNTMLINAGSMTGFCKECSHLEADAAHIEWWQNMIDSALTKAPQETE